MNCTVSCASTLVDGMPTALEKRFEVDEVDKMQKFLEMEISDIFTTFYFFGEIYERNCKKLSQDLWDHSRKIWLKFVVLGARGGDSSVWKKEQCYLNCNKELLT